MITDDPSEPLEAIPIDTRPSNPLGSIFAWIGVIVVVFFVGWWVWTRWISPPVGGTIARYVNKETSFAFESPADEFRATFPTEWRRTTDANEFGEIIEVGSNPGGGYTFTVTKTPQPESTLESYTSSLNQIAGQFASGSEIVDQKPPVPFRDVAVKSIVYRKGDTYWRVQLQLLKNRLYTMVVKAPNDDPEPYNTLIRSFQILGPR